MLKKWMYGIKRNMRYKQEDKERSLARLISEFYIDMYITAPEKKSLEEVYRKANADIDTMRITRLEYRNSNIYITLCRPGLLIGSHGDNITALKKYLHSKIQFNALNIAEEKIIPFLYSYIPDFDLDLD